MCPVLPRTLFDLNPEFKICLSDSSVEPESAILHDTSELLSSNNNDNRSHGLFNDKYPLHVIPHPIKKNTFTNRISYDTQSNSYYENGIIDKKYLEFWGKGALYYENLRYVTQYSCDRTKDMTALLPNHDHSSIIYKFDYSSYKNLRISLLNIKLKCFSENYNWVISISTDQSNDNNDDNNDSNDSSNSTNTTSNSVVPIKWKKIKETNKDISEILTYYISNKKFFYVKVEVFWNGHCYIRNVQLFPSTKIKRRSNNINNIEKNFTFDVIVELSPSPLLLKLFKNLNFKSKNSCVIEKGKSSRNNSIINNNNNNHENKLILGGLFNDKYKFNILQSKEKEDVYTHRISYDVIKDAYYENGIIDVKYLKRWDRGTFTHNNIYYYPESSSDAYMCRTLSHDEKNLPAYITWKFDYRIGNLYLSSLKLKLSLSDIEKIQWSIQLLPTRKNPNPEFKSIDLLQKNENLDNDNDNDNDLNDLNDFDYIIDLTEIIKDEYGFILKASLNEIGIYENCRLFSVKEYGPSLLFNYDRNFCMDIKIELKPNIICDLINHEEKKFIINNDNDKNLLLFNDKNNSDFIIKLESSKENNDITKEKIFYTHTKILSSRSDYFHALLNSNMIESRNGYLKLNNDDDISYHILEKLLLFIYNDNIENINEMDIDDWIDLLYASSRFLLPKLFQICELSIRNLINFDNVENVEMAAHDCCSTQLIKFCEMFEIKNEKEKNMKEIIEIPNKPVSVVSIVSIVKEFFKKRFN